MLSLMMKPTVCYCNKPEKMSKKDREEMKIPFDKDTEEEYFGCGTNCINKTVSGNVLRVSVHQEWPVEIEDFNCMNMQRFIQCVLETGDGVFLRVNFSLRAPS